MTKHDSFGTSVDRWKFAFMHYVTMYIKNIQEPALRCTNFAATAEGPNPAWNNATALRLLRKRKRVQKKITERWREMCSALTLCV